MPHKPGGGHASLPPQHLLHHLALHEFVDQLIWLIHLPGWRRADSFDSVAANNGLDLTDGVGHCGASEELRARNLHIDEVLDVGIDVAGEPDDEAMQLRTCAPQFSTLVT